MRNSEAPPSQGLVAGKYQLVRLIGRGGMGSVWEARHASLGTPSAIKFIESEYADSQEARSRFDKEAKAAATIQSKHAIQIYDHGVTDDGKPYIVMELLQGEPLDKAIERGPLSLQDTARIIQQVCRGLARAHERGIIHRDLKPENIFLVRTPDDDEAIAKVLDFGIAKMQSSPGISGGLTSSTKTGAVLGTPFYMSPEQARGLRNVDHRADIWSLGVIAFKCVIGKLPFDGESVGDLLVKICTAPLPVPSQVASSLGIRGVPSTFDIWFNRALEREPERRFSSVTELADALCMTAGVQTRGAGRPLSQLGAAGYSSSGGSAPSDGVGTPQAAPTPHGATSNSPTHGVPTPAGGAMTNAPFTREEIPGVSSGRGKLVVGGILASLVAAGAVVGLTIVLRKSAGVRPDTTSGAVLVTPAMNPETTASKAPEPPSIPAVPPPATKDTDESHAPAALPVAPKATSKAPPTPPAPRTTPSSPAKTASSPPLPPPSPTTLPTPAPTPTVPTKKPNKNDPGY